MALQFSDTSDDKNGLLQECESLVFGDDSYGRITNDLPLRATFTRYLNEALNRVASLILSADGRWQWDDNNNPDYPIGSGTITSGQQDYPMPVTYLKILRVEVQAAGGEWRKLEPIDPQDLFDQSVTSFLNSQGTPQFYDKMANSVFLYPTPNYTQAASLKIWFQRPPVYFVSSDTTKQPGFNSMFHRLVALIASRDYALTKSLSVAKGIGEIVIQQEDALAESYAVRDDDDHPRIGVRQINYR